MVRMRKAWRRFNEKGQNTVEYLMMIALIVGVVGVLGVAFRSQIGNIFGGIVSGITQAGGSLMNQSNNSN